MELDYTVNVNNSNNVKSVPSHANSGRGEVFSAILGMFLSSLVTFSLFCLLRLFREIFLVNADKVKRKLPNLLLDGNTSTINGWKAFMRYRYHFEQFKRRNPEEFNSLTNRVLADLAEFEKAANAIDKKATEEMLLKKV
jgi:hypothetical protein